MKKLFLFLFLMMTSPAWAATYYVSTTGLDAHACSTTDSAATNKLTISGGIDCLTNPGDILYVHSGTYTAGFALISLNGAAGSPITIARHPSDAVDSVIIRPSASVLGAAWGVVISFLIVST